ncbi:MAG: thioredoxin [Candidatus Omnitrophota bacterium]
MSSVQLTVKNFEQEVLKSSVPVLVDFWAEWCGPCKMVSPVIDEVAKEFSDRIKVGKVNIDEAQDLAMRYSVMSIPTLMFFKDGQPVDQVIGAVGKDQLISKINQNL